MTDTYILDLDGRTPKPEPDLIAWAERIETVPRHVAKTTIDKWLVSTVFLGVNHNLGIPPLLFETMIFDADGNELPDSQRRCSTWEEAEVQHRDAIETIGRLRSRES